jgi:uncharacterized membrane protein
MPLTYQPFAQVPELETIVRESEMNISETERVLSHVGGAGLIAAGFAGGGWSRWVFFALGAAFVRRGWTGHCPINERLKIDNRHPARPAKNGRTEKLENASAGH